MRIHCRYRLGIDLGTNSLGFALIELRSGIPYDILHMGVRIFSDGRDEQTKTSLAVDRRMARGLRRRRDRLVRRKQQLMEMLISCGLMPKDRQERKALQKLDPYLLRAQGLDEPLSAYELGRALFHLNQRRGFQSNKRQDSKDKDSGAVYEAAQRLKALCEEKDYRTYGEFLRHIPEGESKRLRAVTVKSKNSYAFYPLRAHYRQELEMLLGKQLQYHPNILTPETIQKLQAIILHQRPLLPVARGKCSLLEDKERAYAALPSSQYFRLLKEVNNLKTASSFNRRNSNDLNQEQRDKAVEHLMKHAKVKLASLAKKIGLGDHEMFNLESDVRQDIYGAESHVVFSNSKRFGALWPKSLEDQDAIVMRLITYSDEENEAWLREHFPALEPERIENILSAQLEDGTLRYSSEAIYEMIPHLEKGENELEKGKNECEAITACGWQYANHYTGEIMTDALPYYGELLSRKTQPVKYGSEEEKRYGRIANPTVHVALNQLRKVVNELIASYGAPAEIAVEFSRELKQTQKEKDKARKENAKNQEANERYDEHARQHGLNPGRENRLRLKLWERQDRCCLYSGEAISLTDALSDKTEVDHILPFSDTLDDKDANKALAYTKWNRIKGKRPPYALKNEGIHYDELLLRVEHAMPSQKWRFEEDAMERFKENRKNGDDGWLARQLTDTSYMARVAREYLRYVVGDRVKGYPAVDTYPGALTAKLRYGWGLNSLLNPGADTKNRDDHRHHAIDALVIACADRSTLQSISRANATGDRLNENWLERLPVPYTQFNRQALQKRVDSIIVSHKPDHGSPGKNGSTSGKLHKETFYGLAPAPDTPEGKIRLVTRTPLKGLSEKDIASIRDPILRRRLVDAVEARPEGMSAQEAINAFADTHRIRHVRVLEDKGEDSVIAIHDKEGKPYRYVATGSNHHIDIYCPIKNSVLADGTKIKAHKWYAQTVTQFAVNQKGFTPTWRKEHPTAKLIMRLHINDMIAIDTEKGREIWRIQKLDGFFDAPFCIPHKDATDSRSRKMSPKQLQEWNARKIAITPGGKVLDPGESPKSKPLRTLLGAA